MRYTIEHRRFICDLRIVWSWRSVSWLPHVFEFIKRIQNSEVENRENCFFIVFIILLTRFSYLLQRVVIMGLYIYYGTLYIDGVSFSQSFFEWGLWLTDKNTITIYHFQSSTLVSDYDYQLWLLAKERLFKKMSSKKNVPELILLKLKYNSKGWFSFWQELRFSIW